MPLLETRQLNEHTVLGLWALTEPVETLLELLPPHIVQDPGFEQLHLRRQKEWLASRILAHHLLASFTGSELTISCNAHGKPVVENDQYFISISHAPELIAVIVSAKYEVGIDVELVSPKVLRVAHKFLTETERQQTKDQMDTTCLYWSAKETLYKLYSRKQLIFKENLLIEPTENNNILSGWVKTENFSKLYQVHYETIHHHILTYSIDTFTNS